VAIGSLQRRGLVISSISPAEGEASFWEKNIALFSHVPGKEIVILSRQLATLFVAQVSALRIFRLLSEESPNKILRTKLAQVADDLQSGTSISNALAKHSDVFSNFYVNMVRSGEEIGKLDETFNYLADYLDRTYEITSKARNALIYPAFVVSTFIVVMILMLTMVIPRITTILLESGQKIPFYTQVVISISDFFINYGTFVILLAAGGFPLRSSPRGATSMSEVRSSLLVIYKLYLSRIADNLSTMLTSGISVARGWSATIVGSPVYEAPAAVGLSGGSNLRHLDRAGNSLASWCR
jgi:type II secretory pathway component PulF